jgi:hypothetical protein
MAQSYMCFIKKIPQVIVKDRSFWMDDRVPIILEEIK